MSPFNLDLEKIGPESIRVDLEPAINAFGSALLLAKDEHAPGIHEWVARTRTQMTADEFARHHLVMIGFFYAIAPRESWNSFPAYIDHLEHTPASVLRERLLESYAEANHAEHMLDRDALTVNWDEVLASAETYLAFLKQRFGPEHVDDVMETRAYQYVLDPAALKQLVVGHLRWFWKNHLESEWLRVQPLLEEVVRSFKRIDLSDMTPLEAARFITGQDLEETKWAELLEQAEQIIFIPNAHIGPYVHKGLVGETWHIYFGARQPEGAEARIPELDRAEIVARLSALADDTRLRVLCFVADRGEVRAQEMMDETGLSQPSISRYLGQLIAAGYLNERRVNNVKVYTLNRDRIEKTLQAVTAFLLKRTSTQAT